GERTELLAELDAAVELVAHRRVRGRREDAAMAERARTEFAAAFDPSDDASPAQLAGDPADDLAVVAQPIHGQAVLPRDARDIPGLGAPERMVGHLAVKAAEVEAIDAERGPDGAAGVAGRAGNEDAGEPRFAQDARIGAAVERDAAAEAEVVEPRLLVEPSRQIDQRLLEDPLHGAGDVGEAAALLAREVDGIPGIARRSEDVDELPREGARGG